MSVITSIKSHEVPNHQPLPEQDYNPASKSLGNSELAAWFELANDYRMAVERGEETPDPQAYQEFLNQMNWAYNELFGQSSGWGNGMGGDFPAPQGGGTEDAFGGMPGADGNTVYTDEVAQIGFGGASGVYDIYSYDTTIDVSSTSATVTVDYTTDTRHEPHEQILRITITDDALGTEAVYYVHNYKEEDGFNSLKINTPNGLHVTDNTGLVEVGEFEKGTHVNNAGIPEGGEIDGDTVTFDGMGNQTFKFEPPFGGYGNFIINGNADITVMNSDHVLVEQLAEGGYKLTVTSEDGTVTTFRVPEDFDVNLNAHPNNVTFKDGTSGPGNTKRTGDGGNGGGGVGDKMFQYVTPGGNPPPGNGNTPGSGDGQNGTDGVPEGEGWDHFTLNGEGPAGEPEVDAPDSVQGLADMLGMDASEIPQNLWNYIENATLPPSPELIAILTSLSPKLANAIKNAEDNPQDILAWENVKSELIPLLKEIFGSDKVSGQDLSEDGDMDAGTLSQTIFLGDSAQAYTFEIEHGSVNGEEITSVKLVPGEGAQIGEDDGGGVEEEEISEDILQMVAMWLLQESGDNEYWFEDGAWAELPKAKQDEIRERAQTLIDDAEVELAGIDLLNPPAYPSLELIQFLAKNDPETMHHLESMNGAPSGEETWALAQQIQGDIARLLKTIYPSSNATTHGSPANKEDGWYDKILFGSTTYDMFNNEYEGGDPLGWLQWEETDWEAEA